MRLLTRIVRNRVLQRFKVICVKPKANTRLTAVDRTMRHRKQRWSHLTVIRIAGKLKKENYMASPAKKPEARSQSAPGSVTAAGRKPTNSGAGLGDMQPSNSTRGRRGITERLLAPLPEMRNSMAALFRPSNKTEWFIMGDSRSLPASPAVNLTGSPPPRILLAHADQR
jgi:hypothetical protein